MCLERKYEAAIIQNMFQKNSRFNLLAGTILALLFLFNGIVLSEEVAPQPKVDERVELLGIVFRLAGAPEYQCVSFKEYDDAIQKHFAPFKTHPVVRSAVLLCPNFGIAHNAVVDFGIHISIKDGRVVCPDADSEKTLDKLDSRWNSQNPQGVKFFAKQLDDFYVKSRFHEFFESNRELYRKMEQRVKTINDKIDYGWFKRFYGAVHLEHFHVILTGTGEVGGYGATCRFKDGHEEYFAILAFGGPDGFWSEENVLSCIVHEFNHSFCNPLVDKHFNDLKPAAERVFPFVAERMARQAYGTPKTMLYEYLVRACMVRYFLYCGNKDEAESYRC